MIFSTLYIDELNRELGTADRTQRFTDARRKAAVNAGQLEFLEKTECLTHETTIALATNTGEYDIEASAADFLCISKQGVSIKIVDANNNVRYIEGDDLEHVSVQNLNQEQPGWRAAPASTPQKVYERRDGGAIFVGLTPPPSIAAGETWTLILPYVVIVADMVNDNDVPFTYNGNAVASLSPYHRFLSHFAASELEKLRKNWQQVQVQLQLAETYAMRYLEKRRPKGGGRVRLARDYRKSARFGAGHLNRLSRRIYP